MKKKSGSPKKNITEENIAEGIKIIERHPLFGQLDSRIRLEGKSNFERESYAFVNREGLIKLNKNILLRSEQWAYVIAHHLLHLSFGHFDLERLPVTGSGFDKRLWNLACDIYIAKFLEDMKFGQPVRGSAFAAFPGSLSDEKKIYEYLSSHEIEFSFIGYGTTAIGSMDMIGLEKPLVFKDGRNRMVAEFSKALAYSVSNAVSIAGGHSMLDGQPDTPAKQAAGWFISSYPLLGGLAAGFRLIEDYRICQDKDVQVAAINVVSEELFINPTANLEKEELKFVMAHEFLHAGLLHYERCQGRDWYLWNVACDYVINGWLVEMQIGEMPSDGLLYDQTLTGLSAESIYDRIVSDIKKYTRKNTFRGYGKGDIMDSPVSAYGTSPTTLEDFYKSALSQGLELHQSQQRGYIPAGLIEEIRALAMPPIPWDVELAAWFDGFFSPLEKKHTYARPSRRQAVTPDIPRPRYTIDETLLDGRTFGAVIDTSGSMDTKLLGKALGVIASYALAREVPYTRVIFCDAVAYDAGFLAPEEIAGRVKIKGRGGTVLQPGIHCLEQAEDFPKKGPILIITDGFCEERLAVHREHAYLIPKGRYLPFSPKGSVFRFD